jgi:hypothetical protein
VGGEVRNATVSHDAFGWHVSFGVAAAERPAAAKADFTHKFTTDVAKRHGWVAIENLRVVALTASAAGSVEVPGHTIRQKAALNRAILDNAPGERRRQLAYERCDRGSPALSGEDVKRP